MHTVYLNNTVSETQDVLKGVHFLIEPSFDAEMKFQLRDSVVDRSLAVRVTETGGSGEGDWG